jgi:hypothetical protein
MLRIVVRVIAGVGAVGYILFASTLGMMGVALADKPVTPLFLAFATFPFAYLCFCIASSYARPFNRGLLLAGVSLHLFVFPYSVALLFSPFWILGAAGIIMTAAWFFMYFAPHSSTGA